GSPDVLQAFPAGSDVPVDIPAGRPNGRGEVMEIVATEEGIREVKEYMKNAVLSTFSKTHNLDGTPVDFVNSLDNQTDWLWQKVCDYLMERYGSCADFYNVWTAIEDALEEKRPIAPACAEAILALIGEGK
ncbi:MAG: hypothetical protein V3W37_06420, partial [Candidatus Binatia bacterium]